MSYPVPTAPTHLGSFFPPAHIAPVPWYAFSPNLFFI